MPETSDRYALPLLAAAQAQKEITHNEALSLIDGLLHASARSAALAAPPADPAAGDAWIVAPGATGAWSGNDGRLAVWTAGGWRFVAARSGLLVWIEDVQRHAVYRGGVWRDDAWPCAALSIGGRTVFGVAAAAIAAPEGGAVVDTEARAALSLLLETLAAQGLIG